MNDEKLMLKFYWLFMRAPHKLLLPAIALCNVLSTTTTVTEVNVRTSIFSLPEIFIYKKVYTCCTYMMFLLQLLLHGKYMVELLKICKKVLCRHSFILFFSSFQILFCAKNCTQNRNTHK